MSGQDVIIGLLLVVGALATLIACVAVWAMPNVYSRVHYVGMAATLGALALAAAIAVEEGASGAGTKAIIAAIAVAIGSPVLTHATARAAWVRDRGRWVLPTHPNEAETAAIDPDRAGEGEKEG